MGENVQHLPKSITNEYSAKERYMYNYSDMICQGALTLTTCYTCTCISLYMLDKQYSQAQVLKNF